MRRRIRHCRWMLLVVSLLAGCGSGEAHPQTSVNRPYVLAPEEGDVRTSVEVPISYLAACRAIVHELRKSLVTSAVIHEIWPDIEQAGVLVSSPARGGCVVVVTITSTGADRCRADIFVMSYWKGRTYPAIRKGLGLQPETAIR